MMNYKNPPDCDQKAHELTDDRGVDRVVEIGVVMIGAGVVNFIGQDRSATLSRVGVTRPVFIE